MLKGKNVEHRCIVCGRKLKDPESIRLKMGSTCRKKLIEYAKNSAVIRKINRKENTKQKKLF